MKVGLVQINNSNRICAYRIISPNLTNNKQE